MLIAFKHKKKIKELKMQLTERFEMTELGCVKKILGMKINCMSKESGEALTDAVWLLEEDIE